MNFYHNGINLIKKMRKEKRSLETSKLLLVQTRFIFLLVLTVSIIFSWRNKPLDIFVYAIPASAGSYIAAICFYLNKAKMENIFKGKINFLKVQLELKTKYPDQKEIINQEIDEINQVLDDGINSKLTETITTDIKGESYYG